MKTQVGIVGAGPAGLLLSHLLHLEGIDSVVLEAKSRSYVESRVRAGVLEFSTVQLLLQNGLGERLQREGWRHEGIVLRHAGRDTRLDFPALTGGRSVVIYAQQEVVKDLVSARLAAGGTILFEAEAVTLEGVTGLAPSITFCHNGTRQTLHCDFIAGCDGFHGVSRAAVPAGVLSIYQRTYPFAWLGILADAAPASKELVYAHHERGFALHSMRSAQLTRNYLQVAATEDSGAWSDAHIWDELDRRLALDDGFCLVRGPVLEKSLTPVRSVMTDPMHYGRLFLAGDAAHILPPTGAKGLNLAVSDSRLLAQALTMYYHAGDGEPLERYSEEAVKRAWRAQSFSWYLTSLLHRFEGAEPFDVQLQLAQLELIGASPAVATNLAQHYVGAF